MGNMSINRVESIQGHFCAITRALLWNLVFMRTDVSEETSE